MKSMDPCIYLRGAERDLERERIGRRGAGDLVRRLGGDLRGGDLPRLIGGGDLPTTKETILIQKAFEWNTKNFKGVIKLTHIQNTVR
jgi:hypothetical protein